MTVKFGIVGCGRVAPKHAEAIHNIDGAELMGVCDVDEEKVYAFAEKYESTPYTDLDELLQTEVDCINICTPQVNHAALAIKCAEAKKHVVLEKPMAMNLEEADAIIAACKEHGVKLFVVKQNRYNEPIRKLKEALDAGRFGKLLYGNVTVYWTRPQAYYDQASWRGTKEGDGGVLMNQASHHVDMLQWLLGEVATVKAKTATQAHDMQAEDIGLAIVSFKNGALGTIVATTSTFPQNIEGSVTILGTKGTVKVGGVALNKIEEWHFEDSNDEDEHIAKTAENPPNVYGFGHLRYLEDVKKCIKEDLPPVVGGEEGKKSLQLIRSIYHSSELNKEIQL